MPDRVIDIHCGLLARGTDQTAAGVGYTNGASFLGSSATGLCRTSTASDQVGVHVFPIR